MLGEAGLAGQPLIHAPTTIGPMRRERSSSASKRLSMHLSRQAIDSFITAAPAANKAAPEFIAAKTS
jgi:hypothetical protein